MKSLKNLNQNNNSLIEEKLRQSEERFSLAMQGANDGLWDWNLITNEVYYSPRWKSMLGFEDNELENHLSTWEKLVKSEDKKLALEKVKDCIDNNKEGFELEMKMNHKDGSEIIVLSRAFLVRSKNDGSAIRFVGTHIDITERKRTEDFVIKTNKILEKIAIGKSASEVYDDIALMYEARHPGMRCSLLELENGRLLHGGAPSMPTEYCEAVHGLHYGPDVGSCGTSTYTGRRVLVENIETDYKWKDIKDVATPHGMRSCWSEPIIDSNGKVLGAFGMYYNHPCLPNEEEAKDLTSAARLASIVMERDQSQKRMQQDQEIISEQAKLAAMGEMIGNIAHQWRQPLSVISTGATGLKVQKDQNLLNDELFYKTCNAIDTNAQYLSRTIDDFRNFIKGDREKVELYIKDNINSFLSLVDGTIKNLDIDIVLDIEDINLNSYANELIQCYINIFNNSVDVLEDKIGKRLIIISVKVKDDNLLISFKDNAGGIPTEALPKVFEPYFTTKHQSKGTGLGLHMTYNLIVNGMNGIIEANNIDFEYKDIEYAGAEFLITLPIN